MAEAQTAVASPSTTVAPNEPVEVTKSDDVAIEEGQATRTEEATKTNGDAQHAGNETSSAPANDDTEMRDAGSAPAASSGQAAGASNGTPASSKKASNGSAKKKSSGIPEHKTKKLNKKKSKAQLTQLDAQPGEHYFARMKGHPPWPAVICDEAMLPNSLLDTRPVTTKQADGTFRKPEYADGGKRAHERTFPVMFLSTNEFAWMVNTDLTPLDPAQCKGAETKGKSKLLLAAYEIAGEDHDLDYYKAMLRDHQAAVDADMEAEAAQETKKPSKSKRKSVDVSAAAEDPDDMDVDDGAPKEKPKSKKRKKEIQEDDVEEKPAKTPKTSTKLKLSTPKNPGTESGKKNTKAKGSTSKKGKKVATSDDEAGDTPKAEEPKLTPAERQEKKQKMVLFYRHKLQRGFLSRDTTPKEEEMMEMSDYLKELEGYPDLDASIIKATKIHKVLKAMLKLPSIPRDEDYKFIERSQDLLGKWNGILASDPNGNQEDAAGPSATGAGTTNGETNNVNEESGMADTVEAPAPEEEKEELMKKKIGTTTEGEEEGATTESKMTAEEKKTDGPAIESAPGEEYKPPAIETMEEVST